MQVPPSHAKMRLKSPPQKLKFLMAKGIQKNYTLNCSHKCPCIVTHSYAASFSKKKICKTNNIFYSLENQKWDRTNSWGHFRQFSKFCLCQQLFAFKRFCMKTRLSNILKTTNATKFIKTILESTYKVVLGTYKFAAPTRLVFLLKAVVEF